MRIALGLEYSGTPFCGWQSQPSGASVQDALERAIADIACHTARVAAAGRTDAGVHARMQVAHFDTTAERPLTAWVRGVNARLPDAVAVLWAAPVTQDFHARFSATARHYTYLLVDRGVRCALFADRVGWYHRPLHVDGMQEAAGYLVGSHDFSAFRAAECQAKSPVKTLTEMRVEREGECVRFTFSANAFLHHMIRNIVGSLVEVGAGKHPPVWVRELLEGRDRTRSAATFAPQGLYFMGADYPEGFELHSTAANLLSIPTSSR